MFLVCELSCTNSYKFTKDNTMTFNDKKLYITIKKGTFFLLNETKYDKI